MYYVSIRKNFKIKQNAFYFKAILTLLQSTEQHQQVYLIVIR